MVYRKKVVSKRSGPQYNTSSWNASVKTPLGSAVFGREVKKIVKKTMDRRDPKLYWDTAIIASALKHNTIYGYSPITQIVRGTYDTNRIGDTMVLKSISLNAMCGIDFTTLAAGVEQVKLRVALISTTKEASNSAASQIGVMTGIDTALFLDTANPFLSKFDTRNCSVLYDKVYECNTASGTNTGVKQCIIHAHHKFPSDKIVHYQLGLTFLKTVNYYFVFIPYSQAGTTGTTSVIATMTAQPLVRFEG